MLPLPAVAVLYTAIPCTWALSGLALFVAVSAMRGSSKPLRLLSRSRIAFAFGSADELIVPSFILLWAYTPLLQSSSIHADNA
ncbi:hypothetical protein GCM10023092_09620 [Rurimicrobium arvi]|uniref:Uncharacterized protein n=1 Tax=Rurimicrobium arvi TaxID=2049916 RepID=A0ABP8MM90_9BACT